MNTPHPIKFYKLKTNEDIVAYEVQVCKGHIHIKRPLAFTVENEVLAGKQMLNVREWVPPIVCANDSIFLPKEFIMFSTDVRDSFKEEFMSATEFLYAVEPRKPPKRSKEDKVVPFLLKDPSVKPN
jgi:hypothetical protein